MIFFVGRMPKWLLRFPNAGAVLWLWRICKISTCPERLRYVASIRTASLDWIARLVELCETGSLHNLGQPWFRPNKTAESRGKKRRYFFWRKLCGVGKVEIGRICHEQQGSTSQPFREATMEVTMEVSHRIHVRHIYLRTFR